MSGGVFFDSGGVAIADLRAAQQSYVAAGQGEDFWFAKVTGIRKEIDDQISAMRSLAAAPAALEGGDASRRNSRST